MIPNEEMSTPTLYKLDSKGVTRVWRAWSTIQDDGTAVENNESGIEGGKLTGIPLTVLIGKNIGKKNETTPLQQVNKNINSKYTKKLNEGYVLDLSEFTHQGVMAAQEWKVSKHRMSRIALHQPKLDGIRCKAIKDVEGEFRLTSKSNKEFKAFLYDTPWALHLRDTMANSTETDGEMYIHGVELNDISSLVMAYKVNQAEMMELCTDTEDGLRIDLSSKKILGLVYTGSFQPECEVTEVSPGVFKKSERLAPRHGAIEIGRNKGWVFPGVSSEDVQVIGTSDLEYWMFDVPDAETTADVRNEILMSTWGTDSHLPYQVVAVEAVEFDIEDIEEVNAEYVRQGFEGTMIRLPSGLYAFGERSAALLKYKLFHDAEWVITGYDIDKEGNPTFKFVSDAGIEFSSRPVGNRAWRARLLEDIESLIGERATIRYQMLYQDSLCPQFGRVIAIRNYE